MAGGVPGKEDTAAPEELVTEAYGSLAALFAALSITPSGAASLVESGTIPALGHTVSVVLDGVIQGPSVEAQTQALQALDAVWHCVKDPEALSTFLPATVSGLTKCLMPQTGSRRTRGTLVRALDTLSYVLVSVLSDIQTRNIRKDLEIETPPEMGENNKPLSKSWLKATTGQIRLALSNVIRLRTHESVEVRKHLNRLCITLLDECHDTMAEAASMLVETSMTLAGIDEDEGQVLFSKRPTSLVDLASIYPNLSELIKSTIYNWVTSLPRVMQANDEGVKIIALEQLSKAHNLLSGLNLESSVLEDALGNSLRDSITVTLDNFSNSGALQEADFDLNSQSALMLTSDNTITTTFKPILLAKESQKSIRSHLFTLLSSLGTRQSQLNMVSSMLEHARSDSGPSVLSSFWLSSQILKQSSATNSDIDAFFESSLTLSDEQEILNQELFEFSQQIITGNETDWRLQAIALEVIAYHAQTLKSDFKPELIDILYPVASLLGSPNTLLREHAITCLNIISASSGYKTASDLIVDNVDYMVNAISLRLNTFDISPQAPMVLVMMIRLTGSSLLVYLDDVVGSIFAALDNFHGYQRLVNVLFSVLSEIVEVGSRSGQLQIEGSSGMDHRKKAVPVSKIDGIIALRSPAPKSTEDQEDMEHEDFPRAPWKSAKALLDEAEASANPKETNSDGEEEPLSPQDNTAIAGIPQTKTQKMLTSIAQLSQHYLTSSSPLLRSKLLALITTSSTALMGHETSFLPLVNDLWPVLVARLYDPEEYVVCAACSAISALCVGAGDFLSTRISDEFPAIIKLAGKARLAAAKENVKGGRGKYSQASKVWEAVVGLVVSIVGHVRIDDDKFDDVVDVLGSLAWERVDVKEVLEAINADAVWLAMEIAGANKKLDLPKTGMKGFEFVKIKCGIAV